MDKLDEIVDDLKMYITQMHEDAKRLSFGQRYILKSIFKAILQLLIAFRHDSNLGTD